MKRMYVHIGMHKTGTSALQYFLRNNHGELLRNGYNYVIDEKAIFSHELSCGNGYSLYSCLNSNNLDKSKRFLSQFDSENNILSEEWFSVSPDIAQKLKSVLVEFASYIVLYVRRPDSWIASMQNQANKVGFNYDCDWNARSLIENYITAFGKDHVIVRPYGDEFFYNSSIFDDFLKSIEYGGKIDNLIFPDVEINTSLQSDFIFIAELINNMEDLSLDNKTKLLAVNRRTCYEWIQNNNLVPQANSFSDEERRAIFKDYKEDIAYIARLFPIMEESLTKVDLHSEKDIQLPPVEFNSMLPIFELALTLLTEKNSLENNRLTRRIGRILKIIKGRWL